MLKKILQIVLFFGLGTTVLLLVFRNQQQAYRDECAQQGIPDQQCSLWDKLWSDFSSVQVGWIAAVVVAFTLSNILRARRQQLLLAPLGHKVGLMSSLLTIFIGYFANLGFPRIGEVVRAGSLARAERVPVEKVMGTLVIDRLMDVVCLAVVTGLAFLFEGRTLMNFIAQNRAGKPEGPPLWQHPLLWLCGVLALVGGVILVVLWGKIQETALFQKIYGMIRGFRDGLLSIRKLERPIEFILCSVGIWVMFYLQCVFNLYAFAPTAHLGTQAALMIFVFGTLGFVIPSPGGMGTFHALCIASLAIYGVSTTNAFSYANIAFFTVQIFYNLFFGVAALLLLPSFSKKTPPPDPRPEMVV
jgi:uncharacterized membrane protein YbhN (UPF0104 family)